MSSRRLFVVAAAVVALSLAVALLGSGAWSGSQDRSAPAEPTGQDADAAERARADLASRLGTSPDRITIQSVRTATWSDASLGLPEPGMMYAQVITSGHVVTLVHQRRAYVYHVAGQVVKPNPDGR